MPATEDMLLEQARRQLSDQGGQFDALRTRSAGVLSAAGIVAAFSAVGPARRDLLIPTTIAFAIVVLISIVVLRPVTMDFAVFLTGPIQDIRPNEGIDARKEALDLAWRIEDQRESNKKVIGRKLWWFSAQCGVLGVQVVLGSIARIVH